MQPINEDQTTVSSWARQVWPVKTPKTAISVLLEEVTELALECGLTEDQVLDQVVLTLEKSKPAKTFEGIKEEAADVMICLWHFADIIGFWLGSAVNVKMLKNRERPCDYYQKKQQEKFEKGLLR